MYILIYFDSWKYMLLDDLKRRVFGEQFRELLREKGLLMTALIVTPVSMISFKLFSWVSKIKAPTLSCDIEAQASQMASRSRFFSSLYLKPRFAMRLLNAKEILVLPMPRRNLLTSGWKMIINAMKPTLTKAPRI